MNVLITGASGLLGRGVAEEFKRNSWKVLGLAHTRHRIRKNLVPIDITDIDALSKVVREFKPHAIIHCAAEKSPDKVQSDPKAYFNLNVVVPEELAKLAAEVKAVFVFISSDYVFSGENPPYGEADSLNPVNEYGLSKAKAEKAVINVNPASCILRIPVIYGGEECGEESAVSALINAITSEEQVRVSNFERRFPSHTYDIAEIIYKLVQKKFQDPSFDDTVFQWCGSEGFTKYEMAVIIAETFGHPHDHLIPVDVAVTAGTPRPKNCQMSRVNLEKQGIMRHTDFIDGIQEFIRYFQ